MLDLLKGVLEIFGDLILEVLSRGVIEIIGQLKELFR
jgi:hypothetical protein